jgi:hypothetical protein
MLIFGVFSPEGETKGNPTETKLILSPKNTRGIRFSIFVYGEDVEIPKLGGKSKVDENEIF